MKRVETWGVGLVLATLIVLALGFTPEHTIRQGPTRAVTETAGDQITVWATVVKDGRVLANFTAPARFYTERDPSWKVQLALVNLASEVISSAPLKEGGEYTLRWGLVSTRLYRTIASGERKFIFGGDFNPSDVVGQEAESLHGKLLASRR